VPRYNGAPSKLPRNTYPRRRAWLLERLTAADGITYDQLCGEVVAEFPQDGRKWLASASGVRELLFDELAVTMSDESVWLTAAGWQAADGR
jgi:hypothetical protein